MGRQVMGEDRVDRQVKRGEPGGPSSEGRRTGWVIK